MTKARPLSKRHNVITEFGISRKSGISILCNSYRYWVMTVITVMSVITLITYIGGGLSTMLATNLSAGSRYGI